jgi:hypothetical protein
MIGGFSRWCSQAVVLLCYNIVQPAWWLGYLRIRMLSEREDENSVVKSLSATYLYSGKVGLWDHHVVCTCLCACTQL